MIIHFNTDNPAHNLILVLAIMTLQLISGFAGKHLETTTPKDAPPFVASCVVFSLCLFVILMAGAITCMGYLIWNNL